MNRKEKRNKLGELCSCGSKKKYKNCCFLKKKRIKIDLVNKRREELEKLKNASMIISPTDLLVNDPNTRGENNGED